VSPGVERRLGTTDAVVLGLASMLGTGVFAVWAPAAAAAGRWMLLAVVLAGIVAACNAASTADLAVAHPQSGGGYVYGTARLCPGAGRLAGVAFLVGKSASAAAAAGVFGSYVLPSAPLVAALLAVLAVTALNIAGVRWTARAAYALVGGIIAVLLVVMVVGLSVNGGPVDPAAPAVTPIVVDSGPLGVLTAAGLVFFAFTGYARIATLGEEVRDPERTIPRAIPIALAITLVVYAAVAVSALLALGPERVARSSAPLADAARAGALDWIAPAVRVGAAVASLGVLLSLLAGVSRTTLAMARDRELPGWLAAVHPVHLVPARAELTITAVVIVAVLTVDVRAAIGFSSFTVLTYYAIANASAWTLGAEHRLRPRALSAAGIAGCAALAVSLPPSSALVGAGVLIAGVLLRAARHPTR
jgi:APA family basic amino acid/polyamine antiporter